MNYTKNIAGIPVKHFFRRLAAVILIGVPMELLALRLLGLIIRFFQYAGIY